ncbi:MAG: sulfatase-like hydrolase/transferase [Deltaproteobacteria bacterium]|nr:sulfatase-like hydrolase/transferase [Deltaproteobacteria bacterium]
MSMRQTFMNTCAIVTAALGVIASTRAAVAAPLPITDAPGVRVQSFGVYDTSRTEVVAVTTPASFTVPVTIPPGARLLSAVTVPDRIWTTTVTTTAAPLRFRVLFESDGAAPVVLYDRTIDIAGQAADRRWFEFGRDLGALAGRRGTLRFETALARPDAAPGTLALWALPELADCAEGAPSLLLVTIDALRSDHLGSAGYARPTTPYLDRFAADATRFAAAFAAGPKTIPSIPQILTGTYFFRHRTTPGLAALLGPGRFERSRAIVNNPYVASWLGGERPGFQSVVAGDLDARAITSAALRWLSAAGRCRTALYLHYLDTHTPYHAPPRYARRFIDRDAKTTIGLTFDDVTGTWQNRYGDVDRTRIVDLYDGSIAWTDRQLGRLLRGVARRSRADRTIVVISADHGEELWEHGHFFHGQSLYDELLHVPLLVRVPNAPRGRVVEDLVSSVDIVPTIAAAAGFSAAAALPATVFDGTSLLPLLRGAPDVASPHQLIFATVSNAEPRSPPRQAVRTRTAKLVRDIEDGRLEVYDLMQDPREQRNLGSAAPGAGVLVKALDAIRQRLDGRGMQLRVRSTLDHPIAYAVQLSGDPPVPIVEPDRLALEPSDHIVVGEHSSALTVRGTLSPGDEDQVRMDVLAATGTLRVSITLDALPAPAGTLRIGAAGKIAEGSVDLADPALVGPPERAPTPGGAPNPGVVVSLWRAAEAAEAAPAIDPSARERLRSLGYVE